MLFRVSIFESISLKHICLFCIRYKKRSEAKDLSTKTTAELRSIFGHAHDATQTMATDRAQSEDEEEEEKPKKDKKKKKKSSKK